MKQGYVIGIHRPFNMPLKSLVWVCRFSKDYIEKKDHDFYLDFFLWMLEAIDKHEESFDEHNAIGIPRPKNVQCVLNMFANCPYDDIKNKVRLTLTERISDEEKIIYSSYKNTSYYITLAKKINLIDGRCYLKPLGEELANLRDYNFFNLTDKHRLIIFRALCRDFFENMIIITQSQRLIKGDRTLEDSFFRAYHKRYKSEGVIKYITSFDKNYLEVLRHWVFTLKLCIKTGIIRKVYLTEIDDLGLTTQFKTIVHNAELFFSDEFKIKIKQEQQFDKIREAYEKLQNSGQAEFGFVNLYDIKKNFRLSYESFNKLLNLYYSEYRHSEIILFSNTVSSIDMRRRFFVAGNAVLKIRIIKKS